ncbi:LamG-like jellyroll fold domain-containing protein [Halococcoides cellulosivorans]|uniref:LamG-like jellyroll fold domain-containing protein n=1 Tax=Halococcoides cellulosivorans TaxID=1679096 RepID=A0A2R4X399_9EURY|nr:LamG-like jellyroll fold domain-containing protein [Halococcoides cellulosivorans]AWB28280.1 hypothetical protein HARCEL1_11480 [Halococcoides cellulosivorans]
MGVGGSSGRSRGDARRRYVLVGLVLLGVVAGTALAAVTLFQYDLDPLEGGSIQTEGNILLVESTSVVYSGDTAEALDLRATHASDHRVGCVVSSQLIGSDGTIETTSGDEPFYIGPGRSEGIRLDYSPSIGTSEYMVYEMNASDCRMLGWPMEGVTASRNGSVTDVLASIEGAPRLAINYSVTPTDRAIETAPTVAGDRIVVGDREGRVRALHAANGTTDWTLSTGGAVNGSVAVDSETLFVGSASGSVRAVWLANGTERWANTSLPPIEASPAVADGRVIVPTDSGLYALNATDGSGLWTRPTASPVRSAPGERDAVVVAGTDDGTVLAVDARDGSDLWERSTGDRIRTAPALVNETAFVGSADGRLYAFAESDGATRYSADLGTAVSGPAIFNGTVVVGTRGGRVVGLPTTHATPRWTYDAEAPLTATPAIANGTVYAADHDGVVHAIDPQTGELRATNDVGAPVPSGAAVLDGAVVVADRSGTVTRITAGERVWRMAGYDATNAGYATLRAPTDGATPDWTVDTGANVTSGVAYVDGRVFAGHVGGTLAALDGTDGTQEWSTSLSGPITGSPAVVDDRVYATDGDRLTALDRADGATQWTATPGGSIPGAPTVADDRVFVGGDALSAYDTGGSLRWQIDAGRIESAPAAASETVLAGTTGGSVWAGDYRGIERWTTATGAPVREDPAIRKDSVYVGSDADEVPLGWERRLWEAADFDRGRYNATSSDGATASRGGQLSMTYANGTGEDDLVGYYRLDGDPAGTGGTVPDYSGENHTGTTEGGIVTNQTGVFETSAYAFDASDDRVTLGQPDALNFTDSFTISTWVNANATTDDNRAIVGKGDTQYMLRKSSVNEWNIFIEDSGTYTGIAAPTKIATNTWVHVGARYDASTDELTLWVNGTQVNSATGTITANSYDVAIGTNTEKAGRNFNGHIDEVRLYDRALSDGAFERLYRYGGDGTFDGAYNRTYTTGHTQSWNRLRANVSALPEGTTANATVTVEDASGATLGSETVTLSAGATSRDLSVPDGPTARVTVDQTSDSAVRSPRVANLTLDHERVGTTDPCTVCRAAVYDTAASWSEGDSDGASADGAANTTAGRMRIGQPNGTADDDLRAFYRFDTRVAGGTTTTVVDSIDTRSEWDAGTFDGTTTDAATDSDRLRVGYPNGTAGDALLNYYRFDGTPSGSSGSVPDYSGNGNTATTQNGVTTDAAGVFENGSYSFDGTDDAVNVGATSQPGSQTVAAWVYLDSTGSRMSIMSAGDQEYTLGVTSGGEWFYETDDGTNYQTTAPATTGQWVHVAGRINMTSERLTLWVNGTNASSLDGVGISNAGADTLIGDTADADEPFDGRIDEVQRYDRALSDAEMRDLARGANDGTIEGNYTQTLATDASSYDELAVDVTALDTATSAPIEVASLDGGTVVDSTTLSPTTTGTSTSDLALASGTDTRVRVNATSSDPAHAPVIDRIDLNSDESTIWTAPDYSGSANDATASGNVTTDANGTFGTGAYDFDGTDDYLSQSGVSGDQLPMTVSLWYNWSREGGGERQAFLSAYKGNETSLRIHNTSNYQDYIWQTYSTESHGISGSGTAEIGTWTHLAAVAEPIDGSENVTYRLYEDGTEIANATDAWTPASNDFFVGARNISGSPDRYFNGSLDDLRLYDRALSSDEIDALAHDGPPTYRGNYTERVTTDSLQRWESIVVTDVGLPTGTTATMTVTAMDPNGTALGSQTVDLSAGSSTTALDLPTSRDARIEINGTSSDPARSWSLANVTLSRDRAASTAPQTAVVESGLQFDRGQYDRTSVDAAYGPRGNLSLRYANGTSSDALAAFYRLDAGLASSSTGNTTQIDSLPEWTNGSFTTSSADGANGTLAGQHSLTYANGTAGDAMLGYWRLDRDVSGTGGTVLDYSGNANEGTANDGVATGATGVFETSAANVTGSHISAPQSSTLEPTDAVTVSAWLKRSGPQDNYAQAVWYGNASRAPYGPWGLQMNDSDRYMQFKVTVDGTDTYIGTASLPDGEWTHVVGTYDGSEMVLYQDGTQVASQSVSGSITDYDGEHGLGIGASDDGLNSWSGSIDEPRIYDTALTSAEVSDLYRTGGDGVFDGNYSQTIDSSDAGAWDSLTIDAPRVPTATTPDVTVQALDSGTVQDERTVTPSAGTTSYNLSLPDTNSTRVLINGTSTDVTRSWRIDSVRLEDAGTSTTATITETLDTSDEFDTGSYNATTSDAATGSTAGNLSMTYANGTTADALEGYWRFDRSIASGSSNLTLETLSEWNNGTYDGSTADAESAATAGSLRVGYPNGTAGDTLPQFYRFDRTPAGDGGDVINYSGSGGTATTRNGVTTDANGVLGTGGFGFDGASSGSGNDVNMGANALDVTESFTASMWVNSETADYQNREIWAKGNAIKVRQNTNNEWQIAIDSASEQATGSPVAVGAWTHLTVRYDAATQETTLWVNGTREATATTPIPSNSYNVTVGQDDSISYNYGFDGEVDEVRMYDTDLSQSEINDLYLGGSDGTYEGNYTRSYADEDPAAFDELTLDVGALPSATGVDVTVEAVDSAGSVVDSTTVSPSTTGVSTYPIDLASATDTRVVVNETTTNVSLSPAIDRLSLTGAGSGTSGTVLDYSGNANDATANVTDSGVAGVFETDTFGYNGSDDGVRVGRPAALNITGDLTLSAWANASVADGTTRTVVGKGDQWGLRVNANDRWEVFATDASGTTHTVESTTITTGEWVHLVGTYDEAAGELTFWVNGTQVGTANASIASTDAAVTIGNSSVADAHFDGRIDEVRISSATVDAATVDRRYRYGADGTHEGSYRRTFTADGANWSSLEVDAPTLPDAATLSVTVETLSDGSVVDSRTISPSSAGTHSYDLALDDGVDSRVTVEMTTTDPARSARLDRITLSGPKRVLAVSDFGGNAITARESGDPGSADGIFDTTAYTFDGVDDAVVASDPALNLTDSFTLAAWARPATLDGTVQPIVVNDDQWAIEIDDTDSWRAAIDTGSARTTVSGPTATADAWTHLLARYDADSDELALYVNGSLAGTATVSSVNDTDGTVRIGGTETEAFEGRIDEVQVYDRALSTAEISEHYRDVGSAFGGNYTHRVDTEATQTWSEVRVETAALPAGATLNATVEARDASNSVLGTTTIELTAGTTTTALALPDSEDLVVTINGTTLAPTDSFGVTSITVDHDRATGPTVSDGELVALDRTDGTARWVRDTGQSVTTSPAVDRSTVYAGLQNGTLLAVDRADGAVRWTYDGTDLHSDPAVVEDTVYLGDGDRLVALNATSGAERWSYTANGSVRGGPVPISDSVFVGANDTGVVALR